jgi:hypothetical protein
MKIDHPSHLLTESIFHAQVESNEYRLVYFGTKTCNASGEAAVAMPSWFADICDVDEVSYALTPVSLYKPYYVKTPISSGSPMTFVIAGGELNSIVSWQISALRKDKFALDSPIVVEQDKGDNVGYYNYKDFITKTDPNGQVIDFKFEGIVPGINTDVDGHIYCSVSKSGDLLTANVYKDSARSNLMITGTSFYRATQTKYYIAFEDGNGFVDCFIIVDYGQDDSSIKFKLTYP